MRLLRRLVGVLAALLLTAASAGLATRWWDTTLVPVVVAQSVLPLLLALAAGATLVLGLVRWWPGVAVGVVVSLAGAAVGWSAVHRTTVPAAGDDITVLAINLQYGHGDLHDVMAQVQRLDPDVVVLVEVTPAALDAADGLGLSRWPGQAGIPLPDAAGMVVRARGTFAAIDWGPGEPTPWAAPVGRLTTSRGPIVVRGLHPNAPNLHDDGPWRQAVAEYTQWAQTRHLDEPVVMLGDANSGYGHPAFRALAEGFTDAHRAAGLGWVRTWPAGKTYPPFTQLDHVLVRGLDVVDAGTFDVRGTDHVGVWARLHRT